MAEITFTMWGDGFQGARAMGATMTMTQPKVEAAHGVWVLLGDGQWRSVHDSLTRVSEINRELAKALHR